MKGRVAPLSARAALPAALIFALFVSCLPGSSSFAAGEPAAAPEISAPPFAVRFSAPFRLEAERIAAAAPRAAASAAAALGLPPPTRGTIIVVGPPRETDPLEQIAVGLPPWAAGITLPSTSTIVLRLDRIGSYGQREIVSVLTHEMAHLVVAEALPRRGMEMPAWCREGIASSVAKEGEWRDLWIVWTSPLVRSRRPFDDLEVSFGRGESAKSLAYAGSLAAMNFLRMAHGPDFPARLLAGVREGRPFDAAFLDAAGTTYDEAQTAWARDLNLPWIWFVRVGSSYTLWMGVTVLILLAYLVKRYRSRSVLERWREEEGPDLEELMARDDTGVPEDGDERDDDRRGPPKEVIH